MKILSVFTHPQVVPNLYVCICYAVHKGRYLEECFNQTDLNPHWPPWGLRSVWSLSEIILNVTTAHYYSVLSARFCSVLTPHWSKCLAIPAVHLKIPMSGVCVRLEQWL